MLCISGSGVHGTAVKRSKTVKKEPPPKLTPISRQKKMETISNKRLSNKKSVTTATIISTKEDALVPMTILDKASALLNKPSDNNPLINGMIRLKFNHYNKEFPIHNSVLKWSDVDEVYCFSFIYKGNYRRDIQIVDSKSGCVIGTSCKDQKNLNTIKEINDNILNSMIVTGIGSGVGGSEGGNRENVSAPTIERDELGIYFVGLCVEPVVEGNYVFTYRLDVEEDKVAGIGAEGLTIREDALKSSKVKNVVVKEANAASKEITNQLLGMKLSELHTMEAIHLREQRDLEDVLYNSSSS